MLDVETLHPSLLSAADAALWRSLAAAQAGFANPLLGPDFAQAVGKVRE
ncbi:MAG TPA: cellulose biosynthesis protein CelD, partial [Caulobacter sp.]|nr:cellulose biosynthesis protein CelD [Caulobacter sp.]